MVQSKRINDRLSALVSIATLSVPFLYIVGYAYFEGYLSVYGADQVILTRDIADYLVLGFFGLFSTMQWFMHTFRNNQVAFIAFGLLAFSMTLTYLYLKVASLQPPLTKFKAWCGSNEHAKRLGLATLVGISAYALPAYLAVTLSLLLTLPILSHIGGKETGQNEIAKPLVCNKEDPAYNCTIIVKDGKVLAEGRLLTATKDRLMVYQNGKVTVYPFGEKEVTFSQPHPLVKR